MGEELSGWCADGKLMRCFVFDGWFLLPFMLSSCCSRMVFLAGCSDWHLAALAWRPIKHMSWSVRKLAIAQNRAAHIHIDDVDHFSMDASRSKERPAKLCVFSPHCSWKLACDTACAYHCNRT